MDEWFYAKNGQEYGPVTAAILKRLARDRQLGVSDLIWREGLVQWVSASQVHGLFPESVILPGSLQSGEAIVLDPAAVANEFIAPVQGQTPHPGLQPLQYAAPQRYYGGPPQSPGYAAQSYRGMAMASMILSICGVCCFGAFSALPGVIFSGIALSGMKRCGNRDGHGMAVTGLVVGIVVLFATAILIIAMYA